MSLPHKRKRMLSTFLFFVMLFSTVFGMRTEHFDAVSENARNNPQHIYVSGKPIGLQMQSDGVVVTGYLGFMNENSQYVNPSMDAGIMIGDRILSVSGVAVNTTEQLQSCISKSNGQCILDIVRNKEIQSITVTPDVSMESHNLKLGLWVKDSTAGIGTLTFIDPETMTYGALGHGIGDIGTEELFAISDGRLYPAAIASTVKGRMGTPGELQGYFLEPDTDGIGTIYTNDESGVYGTLTQSAFECIDDLGILMPVDDGSVIHEGSATILSTISGTTPAMYEIEITSLADRENNVKNISIRVTDNNLIEQTGGIVQGMSGSPIIQDGYVVGAVTHVLINNPEMGYGISICNMLENIQ